MVSKVKTADNATDTVQYKPYTQKRGEAYMSPKMMLHFKEILEMWRAQLMKEVDRTVDHMQGESSSHPDPLDRASQEEEFSFALRTRDRERRLLKKIEDAIESIEKEEYGYCDTCGADIGVGRLEARPTATLCIDCKTIDEIKERQMG